MHNAVYILSSPLVCIFAFKQDWHIYIISVIIVAYKCYYYYIWNNKCDELAGVIVIDLFLYFIAFRVLAQHHKSVVISVKAYETNLIAAHIYIYEGVVGEIKSFFYLFYSIFSL